MAAFPGIVIRAGQFRNVREVTGLDVLVAGPGNSGVDLLGHLAGSDARKVWLSAATQPAPESSQLPDVSYSSSRDEVRPQARVLWGRRDGFRAVRACGTIPRCCGLRL
jgi:cation diffusion facilitator CzcD-associated flavoprotein CzcO